MSHSGGLACIASGSQRHRLPAPHLQLLPLLVQLDKLHQPGCSFRHGAMHVFKQPACRMQSSKGQRHRLLAQDCTSEQDMPHLLAGLLPSSSMTPPAPSTPALASYPQPRLRRTVTLRRQSSATGAQSRAAISAMQLWGCAATLRRAALCR